LPWYFILIKNLTWRFYVKKFCVKTEIFLDFVVFCSIFSKHLFAGFLRFLPETRGYAAQIHPYNTSKASSIVG
jgi:hypothetical protein